MSGACKVPSDHGVKTDISGPKKIGHILLKIFFLKLNLQDEGQLYVNFLFYILIIYRICLLFQFLGRDIRMRIPSKWTRQ